MESWRCGHSPFAGVWDAIIAKHSMNRREDMKLGNYDTPTNSLPHSHTYMRQSSHGRRSSFPINSDQLNDDKFKTFAIDSGLRNNCRFLTSPFCDLLAMRCLFPIIYLPTAMLQTAISKHGP